jgi:hypothetical protein
MLFMYPHVTCRWSDVHNNSYHSIRSDWLLKSSRSHMGLGVNKTADDYFLHKLIIGSQQLLVHRGEQPLHSTSSYHSTWSTTSEMRDTATTTPKLVLYSSVYFLLASSPWYCSVVHRLLARFLPLQTTEAITKNVHIQKHVICHVTVHNLLTGKWETSDCTLHVITLKYIHAHFTALLCQENCSFFNTQIL